MRNRTRHITQKTVASFMALWLSGFVFLFCCGPTKAAVEETKSCPFANLPETKGGRWGTGLTAAKMAGCRWLEPVLVGQFEFLEWTGDNHLRHSKFIGLRSDKRASEVIKELPALAV